jgi:membrane-associated protein
MADTREVYKLGSRANISPSIQSPPMELLADFWDLIVHLDTHLESFVAQHGAWVYALLFAIVFCETGLVVTPFLPGDSLLFVAGAIAAVGGMDIVVVSATLVAAALCGDNVTYWVGRWLGPKVFSSGESRWLNKEHLQRAHAFYERHGGKTIILARFMPIVRTYAPFVAGIGAMPYMRYLSYCVAGALLWVVSLCTAGYFFGNIPAVKNNLTVVIVAIVFLSVSPAVIAWARSKRGSAVR